MRRTIIFIGIIILITSVTHILAQNKNEVNRYQWEGFINNKYPVEVCLEKKGSILQGQIIYTKTKNKTPIRLIGYEQKYTDDTSSFYLQEMLPDGTISGVITGEVSKNEGFDGTWRGGEKIIDNDMGYTRIDEKKYSVQLSASQKPAPQLFSWTIDKDNCMGTYNYSNGELLGSGILELYKKNGKLFCTITAVTSAPYFNIADVEEQECIWEEDRFIFNNGFEENLCEFELIPFNDFVVVNQIGGEWPCGFGMGASIDGTYIKQQAPEISQNSDTPTVEQQNASNKSLANTYLQKAITLWYMTEASPVQHNTQTDVYTLPYFDYPNEAGKKKICSAFKVVVIADTTINNQQWFRFTTNPEYGKVTEGWTQSENLALKSKNDELYSTILYMQRIPSSINSKIFPHTCTVESVVQSLGKPLSITKETDDWNDVFETYITHVTINYSQTVIELLGDNPKKGLLPEQYGLLSFESTAPGFRFAGIEISDKECNQSYLTALASPIEWEKTIDSETQKPVWTLAHSGEISENIIEVMFNEQGFVEKMKHSATVYSH